MRFDNREDIKFVYSAQLILDSELKPASYPLYRGIKNGCE